MAKKTIVKRGGKLVIRPTAEEKTRRAARAKARDKNMSAPERDVLMADLVERLSALEAWARLQGFTD
jgi:hypothetical protein